MDSSRRRIEELFHAAADLPAAERGAYLDSHCADDPASRGEVERLLAALESDADAFLKTPVYGGPGVVVPAVGDPPRHIGRYEIVRRIGEGGMGVVFEARQESPSRTVALKVIRPGLTSSGLLRRFKHEAEVLGQLQHPGIAHIYEAGIAQVAGPDGLASHQPFFAMEFIRGRPLNVYAAEQGLATRQRLELMASVADAVQHAHQKGVIHRDLKPANILVADEDARPQSRDDSKSRDSGPRTQRSERSSIQPKILDFGVARMTDADLQTASLQTDVGQLVGTVPYMSPEQVMGDSRQLDTRSDVYALGVILYELLAERLPHDVRHRSIPEAARIIREEEPPRLSSINPVLRGDVETIVAKALEKDKDRRYASAAELAADIRRYLRDEPIIARPAGTAYQIHKFAQRNPRLVAALVALFVVLVGSTAVSLTLLMQARSARRAETVQRQRAVEQRHEAEREAKRANTINQFVLEDMLGAANPNQDGYKVRVVDVLARAAENAGQRFKDEPALEGQVRATLGATYSGLGLLREGIEQLEKARALLANSLGADHPQTLDACIALATAHSGARELERCEAVLRDAAARAKRALAEDDPLRIKIIAGLGDAIQTRGGYAEAEPILRDAVAGQERTLGKDHRDTLNSLNSLAACLSAQGKTDEAIDLQRELVDRARRSFGRGHPLRVASLNNLVNILGKRGRYEEAVPFALELSASCDEAMPPGHPTRAIGAMTCGNALMQVGRYAEAEPFLKNAWEVLRANFGEARFEPERAAALLRDLYGRWKKVDEACLWSRRALLIRIRIAGPGEMPSLTRGLREHAARLTRLGRASDPASILRGIAQEFATLAPADDRSRCRLLGNLGRLMLEQDLPEEAETMLRAGHAALGTSTNVDEDREIVIGGLIAAYERLGRSADAAEWKARRSPTTPLPPVASQPVQ